MIHLAQDNGLGMVTLLCGLEAGTVVSRGEFEARSLSRCCPGCAKALALYKIELLREVQLTETGIETYFVRLGKHDDHLETVSVVAQSKKEATRMAESIAFRMKAIEVLTTSEWIAAKNAEQAA